MKLHEEPETTSGKSNDLPEDAIDYGFGSFQMNLAKWTLTGPDGPVSLTPKEFGVLGLLVKSRGGLVSAKTLLEKVWDGTSVHKNNVPQVIRRLRAIFKNLDPGKEYISNRPGIGYWVAVTVSIEPTESKVEIEVSESDESDAVPDLAPDPPSGNRIISRRDLYGGALLVLGTLFLVFLSSGRGRPTTLLVTQTSHLTEDHLPKRGPLLCDGRRVWFEEQLEGTWRIVSVSVDGGDVIQFDVPVNDVRLHDVASDGSALLISAGQYQTFWAWPTSGGAPQMLSSRGGTAAWTPDKSVMAFGYRNTLTLVGNAVSPITIPLSSAFAEYPRWSPGGEQITFTSVDLKSSLRHVWLADRRGKHVRPILGLDGTGQDQGRGSWTRDGAYYLFASGTPIRHDLWALPRPDGFWGSHFAKPSRLTYGPDNWDWPATGSKTDQLFAIGESIHGRLVQFSRSESAWRPYLGGIPAYELDFSKDGKWVAYIRYPDHTVWKAKIDGSQVVQLTSANMEAHQPHWSPDGSQIAFIGQRPGANWRIMTITLNGKTEELLPGGGDQGVPTWSPDGHTLIYGDWLYRKKPGLMGLYLLDSITRQSRPFAGSENLWTPRWSPDGTYICALRPDSTSLLLTRAGESSWTEIVKGVDLDNLAWSSDSKYIYLTINGGAQLVRVHIPTGTLEPISDIHEFPITGERWFGVAPDGSPLGLQGFAEQEIYSLRWILP